MGLFDRDKDKEKPDFSNVESGASSTAPEPTESQSGTYVVQKGDTLWAIAERFYGNGSEWPKIHEANRDRIEDPDMIQPGWELTIPGAEGGTV
ncbi:MAG TPA: LysM peptidoglycan-binding domain-containing protein [Gemmatimonadota bacterium]|nr:LysM peptidoglycan-binding domain-containing protein [Gemmatimonadota bacterium]